MSAIKILFKMSDQSFVFEELLLAPHYVDLMAGIVKEAAKQNMDQVSFGYALHDGGIVAQNSWPAPGVRYVQTDQEILEVERVPLVPERAYALHVWLEFSGIYFQGQYNFTSPVVPEVPLE